MKNYSNSADAISDLHRKGFTNDFQLSGNDLLWVQESVLIRAGEFTIVEYHKIGELKNNRNEPAVFGIIALYHNIKGILFNRGKGFSTGIAPVLVKKLNELDVQCAARQELCMQ